MKTVTALACVLLTISATAAGIDDGSAKEKKIRAGEARSTACQACHGGDGIAVSADVPNLAGQQIAYLQQQLDAFRNGDRKHEIMNPIAKQLSDADIENLAAFWNSLTSGSKRTADTAAAAVRKSQMDFPAGFPEKFSIYRTDESAADKAVTYYYANDVALQAARAGKSLPDGSVIVVAGNRVKLDAEKNPLMDSAGHLIADAPTFFSAMESRREAGKAVPELLRNGDWIYALFNAQRVRNDNANYAKCFGCHKAAAVDSYVFSRKELAKKA